MSCQHCAVRSYARGCGMLHVLRSTWSSDRVYASCIRAATRKGATLLCRVPLLSHILAVHGACWAATGQNSIVVPCRRTCRLCQFPHWTRSANRLLSDPAGNAPIQEATRPATYILHHVCRHTDGLRIGARPHKRRWEGGLLTLHVMQSAIAVQGRRTNERMQAPCCRAAVRPEADGPWSAAFGAVVPTTRCGGA